MSDVRTDEMGNPIEDEKLKSVSGGSISPISPAALGGKGGSNPHKASIDLKDLNINADSDLNAGGKGHPGTGK